jgi:hypothetical protein
VARKTPPRPTNLEIASTVLKRGMASDKRELMRQGVILRAQTIPDRRKVQNKRACRKGARWD